MRSRQAVNCSEGRTRALQQRTLEGATDGTAGLINELAAKQATDFGGARNLLMESLGGIPIGRPARPRARSSRRRLSPRLSLRRAKTARPEPTLANSPDRESIKSEGFTRKIADVREADFRLANRCTGRFRGSFQHFSFARLTPLGRFAERAVMARLYWKSP